MKEELQKIVFLVVLLVFAGEHWFFFFIAGYGCGLGGGHDFSCRIGPWSLFILSLVLSIIFVKATIQTLRNSITKETQRKVFLVALGISLLAPSLFFIHENISQKDQLKYFEGIYPKACEVGYSIIPWGSTFGSKINKDGCYNTLRICDKIMDSNIRDDCYRLGVEMPSINVKSEAFTKYEDCDVYSASTKQSCIERIASLTGDFKICEGRDPVIIDTQSGQNIYHAMRLECVNQVFYPNDPYSEDSTGNFLYIDQAWQNFNADGEKDLCLDRDSIVDRDMCYVYIALNYHYKDTNEICAKISNTYPWIRSDCFELAKNVPVLIKNN